MAEFALEIVLFETCGQQFTHEIEINEPELTKDTLTEIQKKSKQVEAK